MLYSEPPYVLMAVSLFAAAVCAYSFYVTLVGTLKDWSKSRSSRLLVSLRGFQLLLPFGGIALAATGFLSAALMFFAIPERIAYGFSAIVSMLSAVLVWGQLTQLLYQLETGGTKALKLEELSLGEIRIRSRDSEE
ncbi:MAG: hypothetical protein J7641_16110 [Cyanobacteria bacterium SID2]|nr:hypothetical protein [Cyanobacteria bacterium SID2]MBP0006110.1 hypothetical protein [Cyanobacteria bacterium SBC]